MSAVLSFKLVSASYSVSGAISAAHSLKRRHVKAMVKACESRRELNKRSVLFVQVIFYFLNNCLGLHFLKHAKIAVFNRNN